MVGGRRIGYEPCFRLGPLRSVKEKHFIREGGGGGFYGSLGTGVI